MTISGMMVLHYGLDYVFYAVASVIDAVDEFVVCYTPHPSHGHRSDMEPVESERELKAAVMSAGGDKVRWYRVEQFWSEGPHRDHALSLCRGDVVLVVDADEVWSQEALDGALRLAQDDPTRWKWRVNFTTLWRSFSWKCNDDLWPDRLYRRNATGREIGYIPQDLKIFHFGYAVTTKLMRYKMSCHGHKAQWRPGWFDTKWNVWPPVPDCHPTDVGKWTPVPFDRQELPPVMSNHPFRFLEPIP